METARAKLGSSTQDDPEPALEREVIEVAPGKRVAVITPNLVYRINGDVQDVCAMCRRRPQHPFMAAVPKRCRWESS